MDVLVVLFAIGAMTVSFYAGGPIGPVAAMAALDFPPGSRDVASDLIDSGAWVLLVLGGLAALGLGLYQLRPHREAASAPASDNESPHE